MSTSVARAVQIDPDPTAVAVEVLDAALHLVLSDGRELTAPLAWFPLLRDATPEQRGKWRLIGRDHGIHWPDVHGRPLDLSRLLSHRQPDRGHLAKKDPERALTEG